ncbi:MAG: 3-phosphoshikimate 1-carboxyvinyltransferase [Roseburia sp.]|nr:3-phosphoshikimate 1-carboxyvinyltransferase [Anaeroplasma bactoclasticum]MCM1196161.1 3-phosphoshikimate 1-carboxyvinyltransferase [Roseburia sp.]MCM1556998.1 3-phosphoshikimate 1-carboxyvinyltransferase [Anaeroplasma bactoclasticum]
MKVCIHPKKLKGTVAIPPSKSLSHRAIIAASLSEEESVISNVMFSKDILATIEGMKALGAKIEVEGTTLRITGSKVKRRVDVIDANESGSTLRFLIPIALVNSESIEFIGHNHLIKRPLDSYFEIFDKLGVNYTHPKDAYLPLKTSGCLKSSVYEVKGNISSQFITGLLFALPLLEGNSIIKIIGPLESKGYVDLTLDILSKFGIYIINHDYETFEIKGNQKYKGYNYIVEGDYSQTAFFLIAGAMGADVKLKGINKVSYQGDKKIVDDIKALGGNVQFDEELLYCLPSQTKGAVIDFSQSPDLGPALTVLASVSEGVSYFTHIARLRIKECDRVTCMKEELEKLGARVYEEPDTMKIYGVSKLYGGVIDSHNDHRVAMALAMASLKMEEDLTILNAECVSKSYPNFWEVFEALGGDITYE